LIDELTSRAIMENTWLIIASDHGENFGEHAGVFLHGATLFETERHVPLIIVPPATERRATAVVTEPVSLRDLPATVVDVLGYQSGSPFPGSTLARWWRGERSLSSDDSGSLGQTLSEVVPLDPLDPDPPRERETRWPLAALTERDWVYIRREGEVRELLFHLDDEGGEFHNLAGDAAMRPTLERMRKILGQLTAGPLTPERFNP
jgi:arylsulfatase A-like enzyme